MPVMSKNLAVVAMSGGVDSSVAALLLKEQGLEVIGISMKTHETPHMDSREGGTCCTAYDINDARRVCQQLDIPFYPINFTEEFEEKVIDYFGKEYSQGRTPNPCVECNGQLKFAALLKKARELGAYYLATGHYAVKTRDTLGKYHLMKARDREKDQSYFLYKLGQEQLEHVLFPIGKYTKEEVREFARSADLKTADKEESQEICFVPNNDYAAFIENQLPVYKGVPGNFVSESGEILGQHRGIHAYTVGQRRGLGVAMGERAYVKAIQPERNEIVLSDKDGLMSKGLLAQSVSWVHRESVTSGQIVEAKIRYRHKGAKAYVHISPDDSVRLEFLEPESSVSPGQAVVLYRNDELLGGGTIEKSLE